MSLRKVIIYMNAIIKALKRVADFGAAFFISAAGLVVFIDVLNRNISKFSLPFAGELAGYLMVWFTFIGGAAAVIRKENLRVEYLQTIVKGNVYFVMKVIERVVSIIFFILLVFYGFQFALANSGRHAVTLPFTMIIPTIAVPIGSLLMAIFEIDNLVKDWKALKKPTNPTVTPQSAKDIKSVSKPVGNLAEGSKANDY